MTQTFSTVHQASRLLALVMGLAVLAALPAAAQSSEGPKWYERLRFDGDLRLRYDLTNLDAAPAGPSAGDSRGRLRFRFRFGLTAPVTKTVTAGVRLSSNEGNDPTSGNVTLGSATAPKTIQLDRAFVTWAPTTRVSITGGKFASPLYRPAAVFRSEMVHDEDFSPDGLSQTFVPVKHPSGLLRALTVHLAQWYLQEFSKSSDVWMLGGQGVLDLAPGARSHLNVAGGYLHYVNGPLLAQARNTNNQLKVTHSVVLKDGSVVPGGTLLQPSSTNPFDHFVSDFRILSGSVAWRQDKIFGETALQLFAEGAENTGAAQDRNAFSVGVGLDRLRKIPGWSAAAVWTHVEQESVLSMFSYSDLGLGGTNQQGAVLQAQYRPNQNITFSARHHVVKPIRVVDLEGPTQRLQVDVSVAF